MKRTMTLAFTSALALIACGSRPSGAQTSDDKPLLAADLFYEKVEGLKEFSFKLDPALSRFAAIALDVRQYKLAEFDAQGCNVGLPCVLTSRVELHHGGPLLVSLVDVTSVHTGGTHPTLYAEDLNFDARTGQKIRFGDVFTSWIGAASLLQADWCEAVSHRSKCPPIEKQALAFSGNPEGITHIVVQTGDYAFGSYAGGPENVELLVTPELVDLVKPEYRSAFKPHSWE